MAQVTEQIRGPLDDGELSWVRCFKEGSRSGVWGDEFEAEVAGVLGDAILSYLEAGCDQAALAAIIVAWSEKLPAHFTEWIQDMYQGERESFEGAFLVEDAIANLEDRASAERLLRRLGAAPEGS